MPPRSSLPDSHIGERLRRLRTERGQTQEALSAQAGVSVDLIKKLEQGRRESARLTSLLALADALDVTLGELTDNRPRLATGGDRLVLDLRDALLDPSTLPGIDVRDDAGTATPAGDLAAVVSRSWDDYWAGRFVPLARSLPRLLAEARITARTDPAAGGRALVQAYQLIADLLVHLGRDDLAAIAAERAIAAAAEGDDELASVSLYGTYAWVLLHQGRPVESASLAARVAQGIEPRFSSTLPSRVTVWGGLLITAMASAAAAGDADQVRDITALAAAGAAHCGVDRRDYQVTFGPVQLATQSTHAFTMLHQPERAFTAAVGVRPGVLQTVEYARHLLDLAHAHADAHRLDRAEAMLIAARGRGGATWFRHQGPARSLVADLAERQSRLSPTMRDLARSLNAS